MVQVVAHVEVMVSKEEPLIGLLEEFVMDSAHSSKREKAPDLYLTQFKGSTL